MANTASVLLATLGGFSDSDYLGFLAQKTPPTLRDELIIDGASELELNDVLDVEDFLTPLTSLSFPHNHLFDFQFVLNFTIIGYGFDFATEDQYKVIYLCSLYLHCYTMDKSNIQDGISPLASALMAQACLDADIGTRIHVMKFLLWLLDEGHGLDDREDNPRSSCLLSASLIWASVLNELGGASEQMFEEESARDFWGDYQFAEGSASELGLKMFEAVVDRIFGKAGQVVSTASRIRKTSNAKRGTA